MMIAPRARRRRPRCRGSLAEVKAKLRPLHNSYPPPRLSRVYPLHSRGCLLRSSKEPFRTPSSPARGNQARRKGAPLGFGKISGTPKPLPKSGCSQAERMRAETNKTKRMGASRTQSLSKEPAPSGKALSEKTSFYRLATFYRLETFRT